MNDVNKKESDKIDCENNNNEYRDYYSVKEEYFKREREREWNQIHVFGLDWIGLEVEGYITCFWR